jgi:hypothetical protein
MLMLLPFSFHGGYMDTISSKIDSFTLFSLVTPVKNLINDTLKSLVFVYFVIFLVPREDPG